MALLMMPSLLMVLGTNVNRWQFGGARTASPWVAIAERALKRPGAAAFFVLLPLLLLSVPALGLDTGPPNLANLPPDNPARVSFERFQRLRGAGFAAPFEVDFQHARADHDDRAAAGDRRLPGARQPAAGRRVGARPGRPAGQHAPAAQR